MPTRRPVERLLAICATAIAFTVAVVWALRTDHGPAKLVVPAASWRGLVGATPTPVANEQRVIVVLKAPSLADQVTAAGGRATEAQERSWTAAAYAAQTRLLKSLAFDGITVKPDYSYARVLNGFAATLDPRALVLIEHSAQVDAVYPVRAAFPAALSRRVGRAKSLAAAGAGGQGANLPGLDGHGVTIALLDTGIDLTHPFLHGRVLPGIDVIDKNGTTNAATDPQNPGLIERHGTELAGLLVGSRGPGGLRGVAPGATILPIRVAGWQPNLSGTDAVYARTDQLLAGIERAVDPNDDGDAHDAVRIALVGVDEPYAAFSDGPEARAVQGALALNTLVVAPAGNDGAAGPAYGSVGAPAAAPDALAVGATDGRAQTSTVRVVLRRGIDVLFDGQVPLAGSVAPARVLKLAAAAPRAIQRPDGATSYAFVDQNGVSLVAGRAALTPSGDNPLSAALAAAHAGAAVVLLYGQSVPPGSLRAAAALGVPVAVVPTAPALAMLAATRAGVNSGIVIGAVKLQPNSASGEVAGFSSQGLAFDGGVKPNLVAPGVALATSEPGRAADGSALYGTVNGTSGSAATVAGAAALLIQMRPSLDGPAIASLLTGYADPGTAITASGSGSLDLGASAVGEIVAAPTALALGPYTGPRWKATQTIVVRNVSTRPLALSLSSVANGNSGALRFTVAPYQFTLGVGETRNVSVTATSPTPPDVSLVTGSIVIAPTGSETLRVPWAVSFRAPATSLVVNASLDHDSFKPSDLSPAILTIRAGALVSQEGALQVEPVSHLDLLLYTAGGQFLGRLAQLHDLLPGAYSFGITGRASTGVTLAPGRYELRIAAWPTLPLNAQPSRAKVPFTIPAS
jgi:Subtilase family/Peptidase inhibitor I9